MTPPVSLMNQQSQPMVKVTALIILASDSSGQVMVDLLTVLTRDVSLGISPPVAASAPDAPFAVQPQLLS